MNPGQDLQPTLREQAIDISRHLTGSEREALLIKCWMSHDARWFAAVASECGIQVANRLNQAAAHEVGRVEARRVVRALQFPAIASVDDYLLLQEVLISLLGPDLLDYGVARAGDDACQVHVRRCFASENAERAGIAEQYDCGIFARVTGWLDALDLQYDMTPSLGKCLKARGQECIYTLSFQHLSSSATPSEPHHD